MTIQSSHLSHFSAQELRDKIQRIATALSLTVGFTDVKVTPSDQQALSDWLVQGYHGEMKFMQENQDLRHDPTLLVEGSLSIISARLDYWSDNLASLEQLSTPMSAYISRYALGRDYHKVLRNKLKQLCLQLSQEIGNFQWRPFTDSAPILEHSIARQSGLGFVGKHSLLIHPEVGSGFFLGEILCDLPLLADNHFATEVKPSCGSCTQCISHCPTQAIVAPFVVDARRCISYLTIEYDGSIPLEFRPLMGNRIYGCDDCQLVCPWNKFTQVTAESDFLPRHQLDKIDLLSLWSWSEAQFLQRTEGSPIRRIGYQRWRRNIAIALGNAPHHAEILTALSQALEDADVLVKEHILWAIEQQKNHNKLYHIQIKRSFLS